jgi:ribA/ribD-fused uncharacterized protein
MKVTDEMVLFWGDDDVFSNFYPADIQVTDDLIVLPTSEHYFMYLKAMYFDDIETAGKILVVDKPLEAKKLGRTVKNFNPEIWGTESFDVMYHVNYEKYSQNPDLLEKLLSTDGLLLVEASPYDKIWGIGLGENDLRAQDIAEWKGENRLGRVLMKVRDALKNGSLHL